MSKKRKLSEADIESADDRGAKALKMAKNSTPRLSSDDVQKCRGLLEEIKDKRDKQGNELAAPFKTLPRQDETFNNKNYYEVIRLPISLEMIEAKLDRGEYPDMTAFEGDFKRMFQNARLFYNTPTRKQPVFDASEKLRKFVEGRFTGHTTSGQPLNPAHLDPLWKCPATPIPGEDLAPQPQPTSTNRRRRAPSSTDDVVEGAGPGTIGADDDTTKSPSRRSRRVRSTQQDTAQSDTPEVKKQLLTIHGPRAPKIGRNSTPQSQDMGQGVAAGNDFTGKSFQQAQEMIVAEMKDLKDNNDELVSEHFVHLPSRELKEYYQIIKRPMGLNKVSKSVQGVVGRDQPTGTSVFKTWAAFEDQMSLIWRNARTFNEDDSEISVQAGKLEDYFSRRVADAKAAGIDPPGTKLKLNVGTKQEASEEPPAKRQKLIIRSAPTVTAADGVVIDEEARKAQQEFVRASANVPAYPDPEEPYRSHSNRASTLSQERDPSPYFVDGLLSTANGVQSKSSMPPPPTIPGQLEAGRFVPPPDPRDARWPAWKNADNMLIQRVEIFVPSDDDRSMVKWREVKRRPGLHGQVDGLNLIFIPPVKDHIRIHVHLNWDRLNTMVDTVWVTWQFRTYLHPIHESREQRVQNGLRFDLHGFSIPNANYEFHFKIYAAPEDESGKRSHFDGHEYEGEILAFQTLPDPGVDYGLGRQC